MDRVNLRISCLNLVSLDKLSKSDPFVVVSEATDDGTFSRWNKIGNTEFVRNDNNPIFARTVPVEVRSAEKKLQFTVYDLDDKKQGLERQSLVGAAEFFLFDLLRNPERRVQIALNLQSRGVFQKSVRGDLVVEALPFAEASHEVRFQASGIKLSKKGKFIGGLVCNPFYEVLRTINGKLVSVDRSETVKNNTNPSWAAVNHSSLQICDNDLTQRLLFRCYDKGAHKKTLIGEFFFAVKDLATGARFDLMKDGKHKAQGSIRFDIFRLTRLHSFAEYCAAGAQLNSIVAVDFSQQRAALGDEIDGALGCCAAVLQNVDADQLFPVWGFGGILFNQPNHCFSITFDANQPKVRGVEQILQSYRHAKRQVAPARSKSLSELFFTARSLIQPRVAASPQNYYALFVFLSEGLIDDAAKAKEFVVAMSAMPVSFVFVNVGGPGADDIKALEQNWKLAKCQRECVTCVDYKAFSSRNNPRQTAEEVCSLIHKSIKNQVVGYYRLQQITPEQLNPALCAAPSGGQFSAAAPSAGPSGGGPNDYFGPPSAGYFGGAQGPTADTVVPFGSQRGFGEKPSINPKY